MTTPKISQNLNNGELIRLYNNRPFIISKSRETRRWWWRRTFQCTTPFVHMWLLKIVNGCILNCLIFMPLFLPCFQAFGHSAIPIISLQFNGYYCSVSLYLARVSMFFLL